MPILQTRIPKLKEKILVGNFLEKMKIKEMAEF
jgi:hypothetical protein